MNAAPISPPMPHVVHVNSPFKNASQILSCPKEEETHTVNQSIMKEKDRISSYTELHSQINFGQLKLNIIDLNAGPNLSTYSPNRN